MINGYYYYDTPMMNYVNHALVLGIVVLVSLIAGVILFFTFFRKKNERKFSGVKGKIYHFMNFNRFYAEDILRFIYIVSTCVVTAVGIATIILGSFLVGIAELIGINLVLRIAFELIMMFIILCRKTVSMDRKLDRIADYYDDGYEADCCSDADCESCEGCEENPACEGCDSFEGFDSLGSEDACEENACEESCEGCSGCENIDDGQIGGASESSEVCENNEVYESSR